MHKRPLEAPLQTPKKKRKFALVISRTLKV